MRNICVCSACTETRSTLPIQALLAYNVENQMLFASQIIPGAATSYLNGAPLLTGSTFAMAHHCGGWDGQFLPNGQRNIAAPVGT